MYWIIKLDTGEIWIPDGFQKRNLRRAKSAGAYSTATKVFCMVSNKAYADAYVIMYGISIGVRERIIQKFFFD